MSSIEELFNKAEIAFKNAKYDETKELCLEGINRLEKSNDAASIKAMIKCLNLLSDCNNINGKLFDSTLNLERVIMLAEEHKYPIAKAEAMIKMATQLTKSGKWDKARTIFKEVEQMVEDFENPYLLGLTLGGLGEISFRAGKIEDAISIGQRMLEIGEKIDNQNLIGKASNIIMMSWHGIGEYDKALEVNLKTIEACKKEGNHSKVSIALNNRGEIYKILGEYQKAMDCYKEAMDAGGKAISVQELAYIYPNIAECQIRLGKISEAKETIKKAESKMKESEDKYAVAYLWMVKGLVENQEGNAEKALDWMGKAEKRMALLNVPYDAGIITLELAKMFISSGNKPVGLMKMEKALAYFKEADSKRMIEVTKEYIRKCSA